MKRMSTIVSLLSCLTMGAAYALAPCNGFKITIKNNSADTFTVKDTEMLGGFLQLNVQQIEPSSKQVFTVNGQINESMHGKILLSSTSLPTQNIYIMFDLTGKKLICNHNDFTSSGNISVHKTRLPGGVNYSIE